MKVLHLESGRHLYGGARQVLYLMEGLREGGVDNVLLCPPGSAISSAAENSAEVCQLPMTGDLDLRLVSRVRHQIRQHRPDLVHLHSRRGADIYGALAARREGVPVVLSRRVDNPEPRWWVALKYRLYDRVITISEGIRQVLLDEGVDPQRVVCVRSAVVAEDYQEPCNRESLRREFDLDESGLVVGVIAQLIPRKGHRHLITVLPELVERFPDLRVLIFGKGPLRESLEQSVIELGLNQWVRFLGFRDDLPRWLGCLDLVVHPAEMEGLGVSLLQSAAAGVPMVAGRAGGMPEIVVDGETGLLVEPGDRESLGGAVGELLSDGSLRQRFGSAARQRVISLFSVESMVQGNLRVYQDVLAGRGQA